MQRIDRSMPLPFAEIEHRSAKRVDVAGIGELGAHLARRETGKLREGAAAPLADIARQLDLVIGKIEERARRAEFLPLEQHRDARHQQEISGHRAKPARARQRVTALSGARIGDLVMVLQKDDKAFCREVEGRRAARFPLPLVALPLIEETVLGGSDELARAGRGNPSSRLRDVRSAPPWRCDGSRHSTRRRARNRRARPDAPAWRAAARSQRRQR